MKKSAAKEIWTNRALYSMTLPGIIFFFLFSYLPLFGLVLAFKNFNVVDGIFGSPWVGLDNFKFYFKSQFAFITTFNTLFLNILFISIGLVVEVVIALLLSELKGTRLKKIYQSALFFPAFVSWIIVSLLLYNLLNDKFGIINNLILAPMHIAPIPWYNKPEYWRGILVASYLWKNTGYYVVIYLAAILGIDQEMIEAARIDGTNKLQEIWHITLPHLKTTIAVMLFLQLGRVFFGDFQMIYAIIGDNGMLFPTTDIIDTYVYRALRLNGDLGMGAAVGLYQAILGFIVVIVVNKLGKRYDENLSIF